MDSICGYKSGQWRSDMVRYPKVASYNSQILVTREWLVRKWVLQSGSLAVWVTRVDKLGKVEIADADSARASTHISETRASKLNHAGNVGNAGKQKVGNAETVGLSDIPRLTNRHARAPMLSDDWPYLWPSFCIRKSRPAANNGGRGQGFPLRMLHSRRLSWYDSLYS